MFLTVTVQTYNHAAGLRRALASLAELECPPDSDYEVLVVDNNSCDGTAQVIEESAGRLGSRLRTVREPKQGLSHARNRAIVEARGDVICFIDDDAVADRGWLVGHVAAYRAGEQTAAVGGPIRLSWPEDTARPVWLSPELDWYLSAFDAGPQRCPLSHPRHPYGCNMSVRRKVAQDVGGFCTRLGRKAGNLVSNEERLFFYNIQRNGAAIVYEPTAIVHHTVGPERLARRFFLRRAYAQGLSDVLFERELAGRACLRRRAGQLLAGMRMFLAVSLKAGTGWVRHGGHARCFVNLTHSAYAAGRIVAAARM